MNTFICLWLIAGVLTYVVLIVAIVWVKRLDLEFTVGAVLFIPVPFVVWIVTGIATYQVLWGSHSNHHYKKQLRKGHEDER